MHDKEDGSLLIGGSLNPSQRIWKINGCPFYTNNEATICRGQTYNFRSLELERAGVYYDTLQTFYGCDSIIKLTLHISDLQTEISHIFCEGDAYTFGGKTLTQGGIYYDTLVSFAGCDSVVKLTLTENPVPAPTVSQDGHVLSTQEFVSYQWYVDGAVIPGALSRTYTATQDGHYSVVVTDSNDCIRTSASYLFSTVGVRQTEFLTLSVFPNPVDYLLNIECPEEGVYTLTDITGKVLKTGRLNGSGKTLVDVSDFCAGLYLVKVTSTKGTSAVKKIIKE